MGVTIEVTPGLMVGQGTTLVFPARAADKPPKIHHFTTKEIGIFKKPPPQARPSGQVVVTPCVFISPHHSPVLAGAPPALAAPPATGAATPLPTLPITESGAYLPMTSGGWILS